MNQIRCFTAILTLMLVTACNTILPTRTPGATSTSISTQAPTPSIAPTATAIPLYEQVTLTASTSSETGKAPDYTLNTQIPMLQGSSDPRVKKFNNAVGALTQGAIDQFRKELAAQPAVPIAGGSFFDVRYERLSPSGNILSLQIKIEGMVDGAAHPYHVTLSYTYDLEQGQEITFNKLFLPGVNALQTIANYCKTELTKRNIGFGNFSTGADPTPENYSVWNLNAEGLVIVFNEYQVAAYAAGPQSVTIPFNVLDTLIDPTGPLSSLKP